MDVELPKYQSLFELVFSRLPFLLQVACSHANRQSLAQHPSKFVITRGPSVAGMFVLICML